MISDKLKKARDFEEEHMGRICDTERPAFHLTGGCGWINDPNGFSCYRGEYHLFYQYHPYDNVWGPMHWGHAKSRDMLAWERLPVAMAPDTKYDNAGCFSGSALELADGRHLLMYTGVQESGDTHCAADVIQAQCLAFGDGINYEKYGGNPVIGPDTLPPGSSTSDFRDPKIWQDNGTFYAVAAGMDADGNGRIVLYRSKDAVSWEFCKVLDRSSAKLGGMWECPDFFELNGKQVLLVSPMAMQPDGKDFHAGHSTLALVGTYDKETFCFIRESVQSVDGGIDFYAPQSLATPDGRRVMIGWMQAWTNSKFVPSNVKYFGQMTVPRELEIRDGKLIQNPVREILNYRRNPVLHENVVVDEHERTLDKVEGRIADMTVTVCDSSELKKLVVSVAADETYRTCVSFIPEKGILNLDRSFSGYLYDIVHSRDIPVQEKGGKLKLRFILDRYSLEVFVNDGEKAGTLTFFTPLDAQKITFCAEGRTRINVEKYELDFT